jgi:hypothetical protein
VAYLSSVAYLLLIKLGKKTRKQKIPSYCRGVD